MMQWIAFHCVHRISMVFLTSGHVFRYSKSMAEELHMDEKYLLATGSPFRIRDRIFGRCRVAGSCRIGFLEERIAPF